MNKSKFEKMKPKVEKAMLISKECEENSTDERICSGQNDLEDIMAENLATLELKNYLMDLDYEELKIMQSFMLTGREVNHKLNVFDGVDIKDIEDIEDIKDMFASFSDKPDHASKTDLVGYMVGKSPFGEYIYLGLEAYDQINE